MEFEHRSVGRCRAIKRDLLLRGLRRLLHFVFVIAGDDKERPRDLETIHCLASLSATFLEGRNGDFTDVALGGEAVHDDAITGFTGDFGHEVADSCNENLWHAEPSKIRCVRCEERGHQCVLIKIATEIEFRSVLPGVPDGADGVDHFAHASRWGTPFH